MDDASTAALALSGELERAGIPYAIGGALALGVWSQPRGTSDVDLNIFIATDALEAALDALAQAGLEIDRRVARDAAARQETVVGSRGGMRIDLFLPTIPFSWEALRTRRTVDTPAGPREFLSAEATAVFKLLFFRGKDRVDLETLVQVRGERLDRAYVRRWIVEMMGEDDERTRFWDGISP